MENMMSSGQHHIHCCRNSHSFQGLSLGSCLTLRNELSEETHMLTKQDFIGQGHLGGDQQDEGTQENCSAMWLTVSGLMGMGLVSLSPLANRLALVLGPSWWCTHLSAKMDSSAKDPGRLVIFSFLLAPPKSSQSSGQHLVLYQGLLL